MTIDPKERDRKIREEVTAARIAESLVALRAARKAMIYVPDNPWHFRRFTEDLDIMIRVIESKRDE